MALSGVVRSIISKRSATSPPIVIKSAHSVQTSPNIKRYRKERQERREIASKKLVEFAKEHGLDAAGADQADLPSDARFHSGGDGIDSFPRMTVFIKDKDGNQLYFYRTTDSTFWDHVNLPQDENDPIVWPKKPIYLGITKTMFAKKIKPTGH